MQLRFAADPKALVLNAVVAVDGVCTTVEGRLALLVRTVRPAKWAVPGYEPWITLLLHSPAIIDVAQSGRALRFTLHLCRFHMRTRPNALARVLVWCLLIVVQASSHVRTAQRRL